MLSSTGLWAGLVLAGATGLVAASFPAPPVTVRLCADADPQRQGDLALQDGLDRYRAIAARGGWPVVSGGPPLEPGSRDGRVRLLRQRLALEDTAGTAASSDAEAFDSVLAASVRRFQALHGLEEDGIVGRETLAALNVSAAARARQIAANLARRSALPPSLGPRVIIVNTAAFSVEVLEGDRRVLQLRAIVGRDSLPTPDVSSRVTDLVFRPTWTIPRSIATKEILPLVRRDPDYLTRNEIRVFRDSVSGGGEVDATAIDWERVTRRNFNYQLVQEPGPQNPLGGVKLVFPNAFDVFLHDTPARSLFSRYRRAFSHGCVRVEHPERLAAYLLPDWPADSIRAAMASGRNRRVHLSEPIPIQVVYWTAWAEDDGRIAFREDIYERDALAAGG